MASVKVVLKTGKLLNNGEYPIYIRLTQNRKSSYLSIGASSKLEHWDLKKNVPKKNHPLHKHLQILIDTKVTEANKMLLQMETNGTQMSSYELKQKSRPDRRAAILTVGGYFDEVVERLEHANRVGYADAFHNTKNSLMNFRDQRDFTFSEVTPAFLVKYEAFLNSKNLAANSIFLYLRTFKTLINYAKDEDRVSKDYNPFQNMSFAQYRRVKTRKRALPKDDLMKILSLDIEPDNKVFHFWNYFRFSYLCWGINFIDTAHLTWDNISNGILHYRRKKTDDLFQIPILPMAKEILDYYRTQPHHEDNKYIFPILNETHTTALSKSYRLKKVRSQYNKALDEVAKLAGLNINLTSYVARHTFANVLKQGGADKSMIQEAMGHEDMKTTEIYLADLDPEVLGKSVNGLPM
jgi:integrase